MQEVRRQRLQSVIREELSRMISREIKDPRIPPITLTEVEVTEDGSQATVALMMLGGYHSEYQGGSPLSDEDSRVRMKNCLEGLKSATGFFRRSLAKILNVRYVPELIFNEDKGLDNTLRVNELLKKINEQAES